MRNSFVATVVLLLLAPGAASAHSVHAPVQQIHTMKQLTDDAYVLYGRGGNVGFLVTSEGVVVIDDQFEDIAQGIIDNIRKVTDKPIKYLINTHHHGDHVGGNPLFVDRSVIVAHHDVRKWMIEAAREENSDIKVEEIAAPHLTYSKEIQIHLGTRLIRVFHVANGHTSGDSIIYIPEDKVVHMGDLFFNGRHPFIDVAHGASTAGWIENIDVVLESVPEDVQIIPGHGEVAGTEALGKFKDYLLALRKAVGEAVEAGKSREDILKSVKLPDYADYEGNLERAIGAVYDELSSSR